MTNRELGRLCSKWQKILRLQDWAVEAKFAYQTEFSRPGRVGETGVVFERKAAKIKILRDEEREEVDKDVEPILIHELVHLHMEPFLANCPEDRIDRVQAEVAIESLAQALWNLSKEAKIK